MVLVDGKAACPAGAGAPVIAAAITPRQSAGAAARSPAGAGEYVNASASVKCKILSVQQHSVFSRGW